ncbi:TIGR04255 family protein [Bradyrhizobium betae]
MTASPYRRAPITEAVIEFRFASPFAAALVDKLKDQLAPDYPLTPQVTQSVTMATDMAQPLVEFVGYRLMSADAASIVNIQRQSFSVSRLAPYTGWEGFIGRARQDWAQWKKVMGWGEVARIGVRYINRIDVPDPDDRPVVIEEYLRYYPRFPVFEGRGAVDTFALSGNMPIANTDFRLILNAGSTDSPLVQTVSFLLDIDISREASLPKNDEALWSIVEDIRSLKNRVFEASITDTARNLFS